MVKPIITRFYNCNLRSICLKMQKEFVLRMGGGVAREVDLRGEGRLGCPVDGPVGWGRYSFPAYEDLTRVNFIKMRELALHEKVRCGGRSMASSTSNFTSRPPSSGLNLFLKQRSRSCSSDNAPKFP
jgi:hypothetical protein